jgi:fatty acid desaturase
MAIRPDLPHDRQGRSRWKWVSVIVILALLGVVLVLNVSGWDFRPFGSTFKSQQPANPPTPAPTK